MKSRNLNRLRRSLCQLASLGILVAVTCSCSTSREVGRLGPLSPWIGFVWGRLPRLGMPTWGEVTWRAFRTGDCHIILLRFLGDGRVCSFNSSSCAWAIPNAAIVVRAKTKGRKEIFIIGRFSVKTFHRGDCHVKHGWALWRHWLDWTPFYRSIRPVRLANHVLEMKNKRIFSLIRYSWINPHYKEMPGRWSDRALVRDD